MIDRFELFVSRMTSAPSSRPSRRLNVKASVALFAAQQYGTGNMFYGAMRRSRQQMRYQTTAANLAATAPVVSSFSP